jgi:hypothetical protein
MIYKFLIISDEVDDFVRKIEIDADATFFDLNEAILESVDFKKNQMTSFFVCTYDWEKETEITLEEMETSYDKDNWVMKDTKLNDLVSEEGQRLIFVFDNMTERSFFMELKDIETGKTLKQAKCTLSKGVHPKQETNFDELMAIQTPTADTDESFYGDEDFDLAELDDEGFDVVDPGSGNQNGNDMF